MKVLGIDSCSDEISIALLCGDDCAGIRSLSPQTTASRGLLLLIDELLRSAGVGLEDLDGIAITSGPGSFTSLRVSISLVKGLLWTQHKPAAGVNTLDALAQKVGGEGLVCPLLDAKQGQVYAALYRRQGGKGESLLKISQDLLVTPQQLASQINEPVLFAGAGIVPYREVLQAALGDSVSFAGAEFYYPGALVIAQMGRRMLEQGQGVEAIALNPYYIRRSQAEVVRDAKLQSKG